MHGLTFEDHEPSLERCSHSALSHSSASYFSDQIRATIIKRYVKNETCLWVNLSLPAEIRCGQVCGANCEI